jgi:hypothetical protein
MYYYQVQEIIKLTGAFQVINRHEVERQRVERTAHQRPVGSPVRSLVDALRRLINSQQRPLQQQTR